MPLKTLLTNIVVLEKDHNISEESIMMWEYWKFEEKINIINEIVKKQEKEQNKSDAQSQNNQQSQMSSFNPNSIMKDMSGIMNKFK